MQINTGRKIKPFLGILHGPHGIGKTCFGQKMPNHIYITGENVDEYDLTSFDKCINWQMVLDQLKYVRDSQHDFKSLVIDTLDSIESLLHKHILIQNGNPDSMAVACGGYGKAYDKAMNMMIDMRDNYLTPIREKRGMNILILAHSSKNKVEDPLTQSSYDKFELKLHKNAKGIGCYTVFSEWVSCILFCNFEVYRTDDKKYAVGEGRRRLFTEPRPAFDAKNRFNLPYEMDLNWSDVADAIKKYYGVDTPDSAQNKMEMEIQNKEVKTETPNHQTVEVKAGDTVRENIRALLVRLQDSELMNKIVEQVKEAGENLEKLGRIQAKLIKAVG